MADDFDIQGVREQVSTALKQIQTDLSSLDRAARQSTSEGGGIGQLDVTLQKGGWRGWHSSMAGSRCDIDTILQGTFYDISSSANPGLPKFKNAAVNAKCARIGPF